MHPTTLLLKILGGMDAWAVPPPQMLGEPSPQPPKSPPMTICKHKPPSSSLTTIARFGVLILCRLIVGYVGIK